MIGRLRGILEIKKPPFIMLDVNGVGYELQVPMSTFYELPDIGKSITLLTHLVVREDAHLLFGFFQEKERTLFKSLIKLSGVGPKMALTILSGMEVSYFLQCVENREISILVRLPGIGKKTAERLIVEMAGRLSMTAEEADFSTKILNSPGVESSLSTPREEAVSALIALGYKPQDANRVIASLKGDNLSSEELIRQALQTLYSPKIAGRL